MFAEIAWKKKQKNAKAEWEAANAPAGGGGEGGEDGSGGGGGGGLMRTTTAPAKMDSNPPPGNSAAEVAARFAARLNATEKAKEEEEKKEAEAPLVLKVVPLSELQEGPVDGVDGAKKVRAQCQVPRPLTPCGPFAIGLASCTRERS
jgi:hypothetical protein